MIQPGTREAILRAVDDRSEEIVGFLQKLIQIDSETGREGLVQQFIASNLKEMGLEVDSWVTDTDQLEGQPGYIAIEGMDFQDRPNVVGILNGDPGARSLLLNGHVDTITSEPVADWEGSPFSGAVRDGRVYGRGSSDMKGGLAAMTMAVKVLLEGGLKPRGTVLLEYVVDEEVTGYGTLSAILRGYRADAGICAETSDMAVQPACIGRLWFTVEITGKSASISNRWEAVDAILEGIKIVQAVEDLERMRHEDLHHPLYPDNRGAMPCAVCMFNAGTFPSATPDRAVLRGSLGLLPFEDVQEVKAQFRAQIERIAQADPWMRNHPPKISFKDVGADGAEIPADHPIVQTLTTAFEAAVGAPPVISGRMGGADTRYLIKYGQTPTVIFGPGVTSQMHAMNEFVPVSNLIQATKILALAIYDWCQ